eukprot:TRINITY_DN663_c0_g1_i1.p1 TRINITY_DN663_c0_g1~~TRINITY_DN663_c0_g1_i1.p1  ORF type:complete len:202 (-),score=29.28 TRINITY_DN663_c0_g1_i1:133-738(-)
MAVKIRLQRKGRIRLPIYRLVAADSKAPRDGAFIEILGQYDPKAGRPGMNHTINVKAERIQHWLDCGAQPTETVSSLLRQIGMLPMVDFNKKEEPYYGSRKKKEGDKKKRAKKASAALSAPVAPRAAPVVPAYVMEPFGSSFRGTAVTAKPSFRLQSANGLCAIRSGSRVAAPGLATSQVRSMSMVGMRSALQRVACVCGI